MDISTIWDIIVHEYGIATEEELSLVTAIDGYNEDTLNNVIYRYDNNAMLKTNAVLYDEIFHWLDIEPFETLEKCYNFMVAYINDLM